MSMGEEYEAKGVICPFYVCEKKSNLYCEGIYETSSISQKFANNTSKMAHKERYCMSYSGHKECPLYPLIYEKWKEDDDG